MPTFPNSESEFIYDFKRRFSRVMRVYTKMCQLYVSPIYRREWHINRR